MNRKSFRFNKTKTKTTLETKYKFDIETFVSKEIN